MDRSNLELIRRQIDLVDEKLTELLEKRMELVSSVAEYKKNTKIEVLDTAREKIVIENVIKKVKNPKYSESIKLIFEQIMHYSKEYQKKQIKHQKDSNRKKYALIGEKLSHSISPKIHNIIFDKLGISSAYDLVELPLDEIPDILGSLKAKGYSGLNVTIPYKTEIMKYLDEISYEALKIGAINTIKFQPKFKGYNTDYSGFKMSLEYYGIEVKGKKSAVLGSGGSSRAVATCLLDNDAQSVVIVSRDANMAKMKYPEHETANIKDFNADGYDIVINCTPVGMYPKIDFSPLKKEQLKGAGFVMDLIYNPKTTMLLKYAEELDIPCANGLYMLIAQAICAQEIWQGIKIDNEILNEIYKGMKDEI